MKISFDEPVAFIRGSLSFKSEFDVACWFVKAVSCLLIYACRSWIVDFHLYLYLYLVVFVLCKELTSKVYLLMF